MRSSPPSGIAWIALAITLTKHMRIFSALTLSMVGHTVDFLDQLHALRAHLGFRKIQDAIDQSAYIGG